MNLTRLPVTLLAGLMLLGAAFAQEGERARIGKLGQLNTDASVYVKPDKRSRVVFRAKETRYVVIRSLRDGWATIVMADGTNGYVVDKFVDRLPYDVNIRQPGSQAITRGGDWRQTVIKDAMQFTGTPYKWGGNDLRRGVDCSGFVQQLYGRVGVQLPRTAQRQSVVGEQVKRLDDLKPGDRLYFTNSKREKITHTGIYIGDGYFIHSSRSAGGVSTDFLSEKWLRILVEARR